ncbi:MAG: ATP-binding domain-containing protein [Cyclobacteriaceae bacterium]
MVEVKKGITKKYVTSQILIDFFNSNEGFEGHLYIGYPILFTGDESITVDALWASETYGIIIFDLIENENDCETYESRQNLIFSKIESQLIAYPELKKGRRDFLVSIEIVSFASNLCDSDIAKFIVNNTSDLAAFLHQRQPWENPSLFGRVLSILQSVVSLKSPSKRTITNVNSKGSKVKDLETTIATLDRNQEKAVIEYFEGIQRIRGLAGSGKTIVLALKAAYFHTQFPEWDIAITFNTRSLKEQFKDLITKFCVEKKRETPNWQKIKIVNAWGRPNDSDSERGIYYDYCISNGIEYLDYRRARVNDKNNPFKFACRSALTSTKKSIEKYDVILVDEAQDLSEEFLKLCYNFLKSPSKRLVYAYDELQKLNEGASLRNPQEFLIPKSKNYDDRILNICYRNSRPLLVTAHSLGFGIYHNKADNERELVQFFDQPQLWRDVGYELLEGEFKAKSNVTLQRTKESSPAYIEKHSEVDDLIIFKSFKNKEEQASWVASSIETNLKSDELLYKDIIVINPIALTTKGEVSIIRSKLLKKRINNHISGEFNADKFFEEDSIAFTGINRAKGNEVPMVYIINSQDCYSGSKYNNRDLIRRRNILFTAITRSKAWVRVVGIGKDMDGLIQEYSRVKESGFKMKFTYPTQEQIEMMNIIHRDITKDEEIKIKKDVESVKSIMDIVSQIRRKETYLEDYPADVQKVIKLLMEKE